MITRRLRIFGKVQGVGYRWHTQAKARELGVNGWVKNEPDGSVTAVVQGVDADVRQMIGWCLEGPTPARVDRLETEDEPAQPMAGFAIKR